jgi:hypothetical protein
VCQDLCVDAIGLSQLAGGFGKVADLARVHRDHRQPGSCKGSDHWQLDPPGCLEHDQCGCELTEPVDQSTEGNLIVGHLPAFAGRPYGNLQGRLSHVDPNEPFGLGHRPSFKSMRAPALTQPCVIRALRPRQLFGLWRVGRDGLG